MTAKEIVLSKYPDVYVDEWDSGKNGNLYNYHLNDNGCSYCIVNGYEDDDEISSYFAMEQDAWENAAIPIMKEAIFKEYENHTFKSSDIFKWIVQGNIGDHPKIDKNGTFYEAWYEVFINLNK